jgi:hypothetical protein
MYGRDEKCIGNVGWEHENKSDHFKDSGIDERMILKSIFKS